jgi:hypothetical protein
MYMSRRFFGTSCDNALKKDSMIRTVKRETNIAN